MADLDTEQNARIRDIEARMNLIENEISAIMAKLDLVQSLCKGLMILAGAALWVDVIPYMAGA